MYLAARIEHDAFHRAAQRKIQELRNLLAGREPRSGHLLQRFARRGAMRSRRHGFGELDVGGIVRGRTPGDRIFSRIGEHLEFVRRRTADLSRVRGYGAKLQTQAREDPHVGVVHGLVGLEHPGLVRIEGIGILHDELARAHHPEAGTNLVAELGLDVIEVDRQLLVALQFPARDIRDHLFGGRLDHEVALMAVLDAQQVGAVFVPASGFLPQLGGLHDRHQ